MPTTCDEKTCEAKLGKCVVDPFFVPAAMPRYEFLDNGLFMSTTTTPEPIIGLTTTIGLELNWIQYDDSWYSYNEYLLVQSEAEEYCNYFDSTLVQITDFDQLKFIIENFGQSDTNVWVTKKSLKRNIYFIYHFSSTGWR